MKSTGDVWSRRTLQILKETSYRSPLPWYSAGIAKIQLAVSIQLQKDRSKIPEMKVLRNNGPILQLRVLHALHYNKLVSHPNVSWCTAYPMRYQALGCIWPKQINRADRGCCICARKGNCFKYKEGSQFYQHFPYLSLMHSTYCWQMTWTDKKNELVVISTKGA